MNKILRKVFETLRLLIGIGYCILAAFGLVNLAQEMLEWYRDSKEEKKLKKLRNE